jgi:hypothetical protein
VLVVGRGTVPRNRPSGNLSEPDGYDVSSSIVGAGTKGGSTTSLGRRSPIRWVVAADQQSRMQRRCSP